MPVKSSKGMKSIFPDFNPVRIKYKDVFNFEELYKAIHDWLIEYGWHSDSPAMFPDHWETLYKEKVTGAKEIWVQWRALREVSDLPLTYHIDINYHCLGLAKTEIVVDGKKIKTNKGEVEITIRGFLERNYEQKFKSDSILKNFLGFFNEKVYGETVFFKEKELYQEIYVLQNFIKQWFKLKRYLPYDEAHSFGGSYSHPSHL